MKINQTAFNGSGHFPSLSKMYKCRFVCWHVQLQDYTWRGIRGYQLWQMVVCKINCAVVGMTSAHGLATAVQAANPDGSVAASTPSPDSPHNSPRPRGAEGSRSTVNDAERHNCAGSGPLRPSSHQDALRWREACGDMEGCGITHNPPHLASCQAPSHGWKDELAGRSGGLEHPPHRAVAAKRV
eukprot:TRINITY_DN1001_c0_g1_i6.p1 TRINITY_DN1001_c0_g1~~TRINITY_DN1001_c0_g1_i6.p1  ORF type:complete len:184 (-),score=1.21 TRINITY_DN1001_c0_g1_i6:312-863(-)